MMITNGDGVSTTEHLSEPLIYIDYADTADIVYSGRRIIDAGASTIAFPPGTVGKRRQG
jgi:hypothetical protein